MFYEYFDVIIFYKLEQIIPPWYSKIPKTFFQIE